MSTPVSSHVDPRHESPPPPGKLSSCVVVLAHCFIVLTFPISIWFCFVNTNEYQRAVVFRLGRSIGGLKGPGVFFINPLVDEVTKVDYRTISFDIPPQELLTLDHVTISVDAVVYYRVVDAVMSVVNVRNGAYSTKLLGASILRNSLGVKELSDVLTSRDDISQTMLKLLDEGTDPWGIKVERVEIKDVRLPNTMRRAMAAEAEATREAAAKVIAARGEKTAAESLKDAADEMAKSSSALQLRYLQTVSTIAAEKDSTVVFPVPLSFIPTR